MTKTKSTKRALLLSALALLMCVSMLIGTTFAWFTETIESKNNIIKSGNLDIKLEYATVEPNGEKSAWKEVKTGTAVFDENALWEPGYTEVIYLRVSNAGSLALKYQLGVNIVSETTGINVDNKIFKLSDYIKFGVVEKDTTYANRDAAREAVANDSKLISAGYSKSSQLEEKNDADYLALVVYMPEETGNEANYMTGTDAPEITLGINLFATQFTYENDSYGPDYDKGAPWTGGIDVAWYTENPDAETFTIDTAEELAGFAAIVNGTATAPTTYATRSSAILHDDFKGQTVKLGGNIDLHSSAWTPIGRIGTTSTDFTYAFKGTFDGQNYTISNLDVNTHGWAGVFGIAYSATINNLTVDGVSIRANRMAGSVVGQLYGSIDNCHVKDAIIMVTPNAVDGTYDNGDKVGGIVGWIGDNGNNRTLTNCSATNVKLGAYRDVGGIAGYVASSTTVSGNTVDELEITVDQITNYYGDKDFNAGAICGRKNGTITDENNTQGESVSITSTYAQEGLTYKQDGVTGEVTLYMIPTDYTGTTVNVAAGTTTIGGYAFAYNSNIDKIVLPSTVTTLNDRAFRDTSASTVVLNEGLTNISYQAFRNALNVTNVVIPSTVTTISKEAFQNSGITTLTIPANVTTIEYGGLRDMKMLETVVIEGNVDIPVYAFRACTNLRTVILTGDNVTFGGGSKGMIFTNKENGDGSAITIYVANETVKERLLAADTAAKDYGGYTIVVDGAQYVTTADSLAAAIKNGGYVVLGADVKMENEALDVTAGQDVIIDLGGNTLTTVNTEAKASAAINNKGTLTLKNGTVTYQGVGDPSNGYGTNTINNTGKLVIDGATIINTTTSGSSVAIDCSAGAELIINSGVIESVKNAIRLCPFADGAINCTINGGTITGARAIQIQLPSNKPAEAPEINLTVKGGTLSALDAVNGFAVYSYSSGQSFDNVNVTIDNGTFNGYVAFGGGSGTEDNQESVTVTGGTFNNGVWRLVNNNWVEITTP